ncbi:MAG: hypothetical protein WBR18_10050 [Anaerolineales bacterium]
MAEIKCPMCSKPNPADAEVCGFCGARLTPLVADNGGFEPTGDQGGEDEGVPGWLARIRERAEEELPEEEPQSSGPDWLSKLRSAETEEPGPPEDEIPDWLAEEAVGEAEPEDDWLGRLRETTSSEVETSDEEDEPSYDMSAEESSPTAEELSARLGQGEQDLGDAEPAPVEQAESDSFEPKEQSWRSFDLPADTVEEPEPSLADDAEPEFVEQDEGLAEGPDFSLDAADKVERASAGEGDLGVGESEEESAPAFEFSAGLDTESEPGGSNDLDGEELPPMEDISDLLGGDDRPSWFEDFDLEPEDDVATGFPPADDESTPEDVISTPPVETPESVQEPAAAEFAVEGEGEDSGEAAWDSFEWDDLDLGGDEPQQEAPEAKPFPEEAGEEDEEALPHVPALFMGEGDEGILDMDAEDFDLDAIELPDWLGDVQEVDEGPHPAVRTSDSGDLAPATIPSWLEAMRPVETFQPVVDLGSEEEQAVETVGPLAGLRGVLLAEPVVAKPHTSTSSGTRLQVTERQYAQAELLRRIVEQEDKEMGAVHGQKRQFPIVRWLISLALVVAVLLPPVLGAPHFDTPERVSRDLGPLIQVVSNVPVDRPALVVFDYEPGYSAELSGVAGALLENLMARGVSVVTLSTRPTGPPLALDLLNEIGAPHNIENGRNYVHLGYLSGGPTAVQLFSAAPKAAILKGFMLPTDLEANTPWDLPVLRNINALSDFGMVAVVAAGTDTARTWAEQATPWMGDRPMVMVLSAGAEPLIRPYFESRDPQVDGILAGLPAAVAYEGINGRPGQAVNRWDAFGAGILAVELILLAGLAYGVSGWVVSLRRKEEE